MPQCGPVHQGWYNCLTLCCCQRSQTTIPDSHSVWPEKRKIVWPRPSPALTSCPIVQGKHRVANTLFHSRVRRALPPQAPIQLRLKRHCLSQLPFWNIHPAGRMPVHTAVPRKPGPCSLQQHAHQGARWWRARWVACGWALATSQPAGAGHCAQTSWDSTRSCWAPSQLLSALRSPVRASLKGTSEVLCPSHRKVLTHLPGSPTSLATPQPPFG